MSDKQDSGDWYCRNCGYLSGGRVTFYETCDVCHIPVEWHDANEQSEIESLRTRLAASEARVAELVKLLSHSRCGNSNCDNKGTVAVGPYSDGSWEPEPCEWCHDRDALLTSTGGSEHDDSDLETLAQDAIARADATMAEMDK